MKYVFSKAREAINGKMIQFVAWVIAFTTVFTSYANKGFSSVANKNNDTFITYNRTLEPSGIMILAIPAAIFAIVLMMIWFKANQRVVAVPIAQKIGLSRFIKTGGLSDERIIGLISLIGKSLKRKTKTVASSSSNRSSSSGSSSLGGYMAYADDLEKTTDSLDNDRKTEDERKRQEEDEERRTQVERQRKEREDEERARREAEDARKHAIYLEEQARKQDRINSENRHADRQNKLAENARREAQELKRKLR